MPLTPLPDHDNASTDHDPVTQRPSGARTADHTPQQHEPFEQPRDRDIPWPSPLAATSLIDHNPGPNGQSDTPIEAQLHKLTQDLGMNIAAALPIPPAGTNRLAGPTTPGSCQRVPPSRRCPTRASSDLRLSELLHAPKPPGQNHNAHRKLSSGDPKPSRELLQPPLKKLYTDSAGGASAFEVQTLQDPSRNQCQTWSCTVSNNLAKSAAPQYPYGLAPLAISAVASSKVVTDTLLVPFTCRHLPRDGTSSTCRSISGRRSSATNTDQSTSRRDSFLTPCGSPIITPPHSGPVLRTPFPRVSPHHELLLHPSYPLTSSLCPGTIPKTVQLGDRACPLGRGETIHHTPSDGEVPDSPPLSPRSEASSVLDTYDTPMTTPSRSPVKRRPGVFRFPALGEALAQLDGSTSDLIAPSVPGAYPRSEHSDDGNMQRPATAQEPSPDPEDSTPMAPASPAKGATAFPFPQPPGLNKSTLKSTSLRYSSMLLRHCERNATPRQLQLMQSGVQTPDRFIPTRAGTPTKESFLLAKRSTRQRGMTSTTSSVDPFGPVPARSLRLANQYAIAIHPAPPSRPVGTASRVQDGPTSARRSMSAGTVWTIGGTVVTEGVTSIPNGRGGRVTSGTNAAHYSADFLRKNSPSDDELVHSNRLALAIDVDRSARVMTHSPPSLPLSADDRTPPKHGGRSWKNGTWQQESVATPKSRTKKPKTVPVIPFRVLDAPALRDDYYCSLLSYSPTLQCLAVGLGPHVYLWSEKRTATNLPDSLTAPAGIAHVTSVSFSSEQGGNAILAIGRADGRITLWSPMDREPRFDSDQPSPVSCLCFRPNPVQRPSIRDSIATVSTEELLVGDELGYVYYYSVEWPKQDQRDLFDWHGSMTLLARFSCHSQQVCGIAWSSDGQFFATGGNDNQLFLFESKKSLQHGQTSTISEVNVRSSTPTSTATSISGQGEVLAITPGHEKQVFKLNAAVKAIAFAPWQSSLVAAGGGSNDRCIHFFHCLSGSTLATLDCHAQVTSLVWSQRRKEIAGTFGFAQPEHPYRVAVFAWPSCDMVVRIPWWGGERALFAVAYPRAHTTGRPQGDGAAVSRRDAEGKP